MSQLVITKEWIESFLVQKEIFEKECQEAFKQYRTITREYYLYNIDSMGISADTSHKNPEKHVITFHNGYYCSCDDCGGGGHGHEETYTMPLAFLYDIEFREKIEEDIRRKEEEEKERLKVQRAEERKKRKEAEIKEYERLKAKFEKARKKFEK